MSVTRDELIVAAKKSHETASCEADRRGVCARAYYAIYIDGKSYHDNLPSPGSLNPESKGGKHQDLIEQLKNPTIARGDPRYMGSISIGHMMATLHGNRVKSDYKRDESLDDATARMSIQLMDQLAEKLAKLSSGANVAPPVASAPPAAPAAAPAACKPTLQRIK